MTTIQVQTPVHVRTPPGASYAAVAFTKVLGWFAQHHSMIETRATRNAAQEKVLEAAAVREYAHRFAQHDPRFAADLLAAADRHEITD